MNEDVHPPALGVLMTPNPKGLVAPREGGARAEPWICSVGGAGGQLSRSPGEGLSWMDFARQSLVDLCM